jgi:DNA replication protein DnaC
MNQASLGMLLRAVKLPSFALRYEDVAETALGEGWDFVGYLRHLVELEIEDRRVRKVERVLKASHLPAAKTLSTLDAVRFPDKIRRQLPALCGGAFLDRAENILAFGLPGRGKTHLVCAIGHELVQKGRSVLFTPAYSLVQGLLAAKRALTLERELVRLDRFEVVIIDDIGYVRQQQEEMGVLFTFLAERYERRSVIITSNLVFSQWDSIFKDPMTTAAAIDRLVHHCTILELPGPSYRTDNAISRANTQNMKENN